MTPLLLAATLPGCCGLLSAWCGPDRSQWVQADFSTPDAAVQTVLEAVRRSNEDVLFQATSPGLRHRLGITDRVVMRSLWSRLEDEVTGLNALGDGSPGAPVPIGDDRVRFDVEVYGETVPLIFRRGPWRWRLAATLELEGELLAERDDKTSRPPELRPLDPSRSPGGEATAVLLPPVLTSLPLERVDQLDKVEFVREWLLDDLPGDVGSGSSADRAP